MTDRVRRPGRWRDMPSGRPEYRAWLSMRARCHNPRHPDYGSYGGRGIAVCESWRGSFEMFIAAVGPRPSAKHSIDRIDNDRGYKPGNVRWATAKEQSANRRPIVVRNATRPSKAQIDRTIGAAAARRAARTHCTRGHSFAEHGAVALSRGQPYRYCKLCRRTLYQEHRSG